MQGLDLKMEKYVSTSKQQVDILAATAFRLNLILHKDMQSIEYDALEIERRAL